MRKLPALIALAAASTLVLSACSDPAEEPAGGGSGSATASFDPSTVTKDAEIAALLPDDVAKAGTLVVGSNTVYAPAEFIADDGKTPVGYDIDLIKAVGATLGLDVEIQSAEFASIIPALGSKFDVGISSFTIREDRLKQANMISYFNAGEAFAVPEGNPKKLDASDVCGTKLAVQTGTVEDEGADELSAQCVKDGKKAIEILRYTNQADATTNLVGGKVDVMYADSPIVGYAVTQTKGQIEQLGDTFDSAPQGIVTAKADTQLAEAVQKAVQKLMDDGTYSEILTAWNNAGGGLDKAELNPAQ